MLLAISRCYSAQCSMVPLERPRSDWDQARVETETGTRAATAGNTDRPLPLPSARTLLRGLDIYTVLAIEIYILH